MTKLVSENNFSSVSRRHVLVVGGLGAVSLVLAGCASPGGADRTGGDEDPIPGPWGARADRNARPAPTPPPTRAETPQPLPRAGGPIIVLPRTRWTRAGVARPSEINPMRGVRRITIHHDGMDSFTTTDESASRRRLEQIRRSHVEGRKWADIGYHYIIDPAGRIWEGRGVQFQGAHVKDNNENNLGIMCMGNYDNQSPTNAMRSALDRFVASQMRQYRVPMNEVRTHQERMATACPGRNLQAYIRASRSSGGGMTLALNDEALSVQFV